MSEKKKRGGLLNPSKQLTELPIFWLVSIIGFSGALYSAYLINTHSNLGKDLSYKGFNFFVEVFTFPIGLVTANITVIGLIALAHRSNQTKEQITISNVQYQAVIDQNKFSNYFKHIEEFEKHVESVLSDDGVYKYGKRHMHSRLFPNARNGDFEPDQDFLETTLRTFEYTLMIFNQLVDKEIKMCSNEVYKLAEHYRELTSDYQISGGQEFYDGNLIAGKEVDVCGAAVLAMIRIQEILSFLGNSEPRIKIHKLGEPTLNIYTKLIPLYVTPDMIDEMNRRATAL